MTHKTPRPNTMVSATFFREFNCNVQSIGMGKIRMETSSTRLKIELSRNFRFKFPQCCAVVGPISQLYLRGLQIANHVMVHPTRYITARASKVRTTMRNLDTRKTWAKKSRIESRTKVLPQAWISHATIKDWEYY